MNKQTLTYIALAIVAYLLFFRKASATVSEQRPAPQDGGQELRGYGSGIATTVGTINTYTGRHHNGHGTIITGTEGEGNVRISDSNTVRKINPQTTFK